MGGLKDGMVARTPRQPSYADAPLRLPQLGTSPHPSSSSTAPVPLEEGRLALAPPRPVPTFKSDQMLSARVPAAIDRPGKKWQLAPVLLQGEERWLTRCGAPPRQHWSTSASDSLVLAITSPAAAVEAADRELQACVEPHPPTPCQVRLPRVPRLVSRRARLKAATASSSTVKQLLEPISSTEVMEARYTRALAGKHSSFWRSTLDQDIVDQDIEVAALAEYRQAATLYYQNLSRDKANKYSKASARKKGLSEVRWKLQHELDITQRPPADLDRPDICELDDVKLPAAPRCTPEPQAKGRQKRRRRRASNVVFTEVNEGSDNITREGFDGYESDEGAGSEGDRKKSNKLKNLSIKPKQPLQVRLRRLRRNGRRRMRRKSDPQAATQPSPSLSPAPSHQKCQAISIADSKGSGSSSSDEEAHDDEDDDDEFAELPECSNHLSVEHRASHVAEFLTWNDQDQQILRRIFNIYDMNQSDTLDQSEIAVCLAEIGLRGKNAEERTAICDILWNLGKLEVGFYEFATKVVPSIRKKLAQLQADKLTSAFSEADADSSGMLSIQETLQQLRLMGTFPSEEQVKEAICRVRPEAAEVGRNMEGQWLTSRDILDLESFSTLIRHLEEATSRERADRFRQLVLEFRLTEEEKEHWQHVLVEVHRTFSRFASGSHFVSKTKASIVVRECGLAPRNITQRNIISTVVGEEDDSHGNIDFRALLKIGDRLREHDRQWLHRMFHKHDYNQSNGLSLTEVQQALFECGIRPRTNHEAAEIRSLINEFDEDCSGEVDQEEFVGLFAFVSEKLHKVQREVERQTAVRYGWNEAHFEELRSTFIALDQDASESLEIPELMEAVENLAHSNLREDINAVLGEIDVPQTPKSAKVDFLSFMKIMKALEDRESQRGVAKRHGFEGAGVNHLRSAFKDLSPNDEGLVSRDALKALLVDGIEASFKMQEAQQELMNNHPPTVNFDVFVKYMKRKIDLGVERRSSKCVSAYN